MSYPIVGRGTSLTIGSTTLSNFLSCDYPSATVKTEAYLTLNSTVAEMQYLPVSQEAPKIEFEAQYSYADFAAIKGTYMTITTFSLTTSDPTPKTFAGNCIVLDIKPSGVTADKIVLMKGSVQCTGSITVS